MDEYYFFRLHNSLRKIMQSMDIHSKKLLKLYGLTGPQLFLLRIIDSSGGMTISQAARSASMSQATVADIITRLEKSGFIVRKKGSEDRRNWHITITDRSRAILSENPLIFEKEFIESLSGLEEWEKTFLLGAVQRISSMMQGGRAGNQQHPDLPPAEKSEVIRVLEPEQ